MFEKIAYQGWQNCTRLSNGLIDVVVTGDVGPRIIRCGLVGEENEFYENAGMMGLTGGDEWRIYGGHRLWHAPEAHPRTVFPDNQPVEVSEQDGVLIVRQAIEPGSGIQKTLDIRLGASQARVSVAHGLTNHNLWPIELAVWAISALAPGGVAILPLPPRGPQPENLLPTSALALWAYTDMADPRWRWGSRFLMLRQDTRAATPQKAGVNSAVEWAAYARSGKLFVKRFTHLRGMAYPDYGSTVEAYTDENMLELETLGPLTRLEPGESVTHYEQWFVLKDVPLPQTDEDVDRDVLPRIRGLAD